MIDKQLIKAGLNQRLRYIDDFIDDNIKNDSIDELIKKYKNELQDYEYIDSEGLFSTLTLKGSMKYINRYDKELRTGGLLIKIYQKDSKWYAIIKSPIGKKFYVSFNANYIFYVESKPSLIRSWANVFVSEIDKGTYDIK
jgi:hypothetical protein